MDAHGRLIEALREHALVLGEVTLTSGAKAQYYVDAKRAILLPGGFLALGELLAERAREWGATAVGGMTMGADAVTCAALAGGADVKGFFVRKEAKAHGLVAPHRGPAAGRRRPLPRRRGRRQHRRLDDRGDRGAAGGRPRDLRRRQRARPAGRRRRADRGGRGRAVRRARHDRRRLPGAPRPRGERQRSAPRDRVEVDPDDEQRRAHRAHAGGVQPRERAAARGVVAVEEVRGARRASRAAGGAARAGRPRCCARRPPGGPSRRRSRTCPCRGSRPKLTGVRRGSPLFRPVVSSSATPGARPRAASARIGGLSSLTCSAVTSLRLRSIAPSLAARRRAPACGAHVSGAGALGIGT